MHGGDLALVDGDIAHAERLQVFVDLPTAAACAREPISVLGDDQVALPPARRLDQRADARTIADRLAGDSRVGIFVDYASADFLGETAAEHELVFDRGVALIVGGIASV